MANRIKEVFSEQMFGMTGQLRFQDENAYQRFLSALELVQEEGRSVPVNGVSSISTQLVHQGMKYPIEELTDISEFVVSPSFVPFKITLSESESKEVEFYRCIAKNQTIIRSKDDAIVFFQFSLSNLESKVTIEYKIHFEKANTIEEVAEAFCLARLILMKFNTQEETRDADKSTLSLLDALNYFRVQEAFLRRILALEKELSISFPPALLSNLPREEQQDIDELYIFLVSRRKVRLNGKLTSSESTAFFVPEESSHSVIGNSIELTFTGTIDYDILGQSIRLFTANLLENAIVKDIQKADDNTTIKILYGDTDSKPMFISFSAFKTQEEASSEQKVIMEHKDEYTDALTSYAYIKQFYS